MLNRPHHMLMLAPSDVLDGMSRMIHMTNAFCEQGTKVTLVCPPQRNDNIAQLKRLLHRNASVYVARVNEGGQVLHQRLVGELADEAQLPEVELYDVACMFDESRTNDSEVDEEQELAFAHIIMRKILPSHLHAKYKDLAKLYRYNYIFLIQALIIHKCVEPIDAILCHDLWTLPIGCIVKELHGATLIYDAHEICTWCILDPINRSLAVDNEKWLYEMCDAFTTTCEGMANYYSALCPALKPLSINNGHREVWDKPENLSTLKERLSLSASTPLAAFVGNLGPYSHMARIIEAIANCRTTLHLAVLGDGDEIERYKELTRTLNLEKRVFFLGRTDYETVFSTIYGADFGVIPNLQKCINPPDIVLSSKLFDYVQVELPVISDLSAEIQKVVNEFRIGLTVDFHQPPDEIAKLLDNFYERVVAGEFTSDERRRARDGLLWPRDIVDQILSAQPDRVAAQTS